MAAVVPPETDDETAAQALAEAIEGAVGLDHTEVQTIGRHRFDPARHFEAMAAPSC
jgi:hypothetical protein